VTPRWITAFLDFPEAGYEAGADFWSSVTGYPRSPQRGDHGQFATLVPPDGADYLRVQRLDVPQPRVHVDLHVDDVTGAATEAEALGATPVEAPYDDPRIMRSPGGFVFCLVPGPGGDRPAPTSWPDSRTSYVDQVCLDVPPSRYDDEIAFWAELTGWQRRDPRPGSEFGRVTGPPDQPLFLLLQRLDDEQEAVTAHLDWSATDHEAEVSAHVAAGAEVQGRFEGWTVLRDPAGMAYCVTHRRPGLRPGVSDEVTNLTRFLDEHREIFRRKAGGLDHDQLTQTLPPSDLTLGGMVKHLAFVEDWWFGRTLMGEQAEPWASVDWEADDDWDWHSAADDTPEQLWELWQQAVTRSREAVAVDPSPEREAARLRRTGEPLALRWILAHMVEEYARHNGHADLIRQSIDGQMGDEPPHDLLRLPRFAPPSNNAAGTPEKRMTIRPMAEQDWPQVWPFFDEIVRAGETYAYPPDLTSEQARALWTMSPPGQTVVLEEDGRVLGSATMGPNRPGRGSHVGTASFMVSGDARGRGVGRRLAEYVVQWHRDQGFRAIQFNAVVETNEAAVHLWEALGFQVIGTVPAAFESATHGLVGLHVMHLSLD
jgi:L-amino acid N-acyltransferase YncA